MNLPADIQGTPALGLSEAADPLVDFMNCKLTLSLLVAEGWLNTRGLGVASRSKTGPGLTTVPIFLLVRQVKLSKRLNLDLAAKAAQDGLPGAIVAQWMERFTP